MAINASTRIRHLAAGILFAIALPLAYCQADEIERAAVPDAADQEQSLRQVREIFEEEFRDATSAEAKAELAGKLLQSAADTRDDPTGRYVLLIESSTLSVGIGDADTALSAIDAIAESHNIDTLSLKANALSAIAKLPRLSADKSKALIEQSLDLSNAAKEADNFPVAKQLSSLAVATARKVRDPALLKQATVSASEVQSLEKVFSQIKADREALEANPTDPAANLSVGLFRILVHDDWGNGLPMLALGNDETLKELARDDLNNPESPEDQVSVADDWWNYAAKEKELKRELAQIRAAYWYERAAPGLSGLSKVKADKRLAQLAADVHLRQASNKRGPVSKANKAKVAPLRIAHKVGEVMRIDVPRTHAQFVQFSSDGKLLLSPAGIWETETGKSTTPNGRLVGASGFSPDGRFLLRIDNDGLRWREVAQNAEGLLLKGHTGRITAATISRDGRFAASGGADGLVCLWDLQTGKQVHSLNSEAFRIEGLAFDDDAASIAVVCEVRLGGSPVQLWNTRTGRQTQSFLAAHGYALGAPAFSPDGKLVAVSGSHVWVWDTSSGQQVGYFKPHDQVGGMIPHRPVAFTRDGKRLLSSGADRTIMIIAVQTGAVVESYKGHAGGVDSVAVSPDGRFFASSSDDQTIRLWGLPN